MRNLLLTLLILTSFSHLGYTQKEKISVNLQPSNITEKRFEIEVQNIITLNSLIALTNRDSTINYESFTHKRDSVKIELNTGTTWYLKDGPPQKPRLFIFKAIFNKLDSIGMGRAYYLEMLSYFEFEDHLPASKISKISYRDYYFKESEVQIIIQNNIKLDSEKKFGNLNQEIIYLKDTIKN